MTVTNGVFLHASSVEVSGKGLVFLGHSTSGKSTIVQILSAAFPAISDDKVFLFRQDEKWMMMRGDSRNKFEKSQVSRVASGSYPVMAFVRIFPARRNEIKPIDDLLLCKHIIDAVFEVDRQRNNVDMDLRKEWFRLAIELAKNIKGWHFDFKKESGIVQFIQEIFAEESHAAITGGG